MFYLKKDGNGGINISHAMIGSLLAIFTILGSCISQVMAYGELTQQVEDISDAVKEITVLDKRIDSNDEDIAIINTKLDIILDKLDKIEEKMDKPFPS